jgi:hypothetical protein
MTQPTNTGAIERATGRGWESWVSRLDDLGAANLRHAEIVPLVQRELESINLENAGWWAQSITVGHEQHTGRRIPGRQSDSAFSAGVGRTVDGTLDEALAGWEAAARQRDNFAGRAPASEPSTSSTPQWRYWRCAFDDGTRVEVTIGETAVGKCRIALSHNRIPSPDDVESVKEFWRSVLADVRVSPS